MADPATLALASLVVFGAAFVQGVTGFAFGLLSLGFLALLFGAGEAVLVLTLVSPLASVLIFLRVRRHVDVREVLKVSLPLCLLGLPLGILCFLHLLHAAPAALTRIVGIVLVVSAGYFLTPFAPRPRRVPAAVAVAAGFLGGFLGGLTSTGGPPIVLYLYAREMTKEVRMAVLQGIFLLAGAAKIGQLLLVPSTPLAGRVFADSAVLLLPLAAGVLAGQTLFTRIPARPLRRIALLLLLGIGVMLLAGR